MRDIVFNLTFCSMLLTIVMLLWTVYELRDQRDFWKEQYCVEVEKTNLNHSVCGEPR